MKRTIQILIVFLMMLSNMSGQSVIDDAGLLKIKSEIPPEKVYLHQNTTLLFTGERLYFSLFCLNAKTNKLSGFSKVAYVELLGEDGQEVFKQRVRLDNGLGQADFFLPTSVASGSYKLIAYTRWMKNFDQASFFQSDLLVINPYQTNEKIIPFVQDSLDSVMLTKPLNKLAIKDLNTNVINQTPQYISLIENRKAFKKREKVSIDLNVLSETALNGNFSISVKKIDELESPDRIGVKDFLQQSRGNTEKVTADKNLIFLPELRGELISGRLTNKTTGDFAFGKRISLSIPGNDFVYDIANSNEKGRFYFNLHDGDYGETGIFQVLDDKEHEFEIAIDEHPSIEHDQFSFREFYIDESLKDLILKRSVQNQIENAYADVRADILVPNESSIPFYRSADETYDLDDYTRFNTIEETMVEIVDHVWIKKDNDGASFFQVRPKEGFPESGLRPLLIVDGVFVEKHDDFLEYNSKRVRRIQLSRDKFIMGSYTFQGLLVINTKTADYHRTYYKDYLKNVSLFQPSVKKSYFVQQYEDGKSSKTDRVPDFRTQLLWIPDLQLGDSEKSLDFFTSDVSGEYEICLEGFSISGRPISDKAIFSVE